MFPKKLIDIDEQTKFILAKEIAYNHLEITERLYTAQLFKSCAENS
jgi:hypothetical protein